MGKQIVQSPPILLLYSLSLLKWYKILVSAVVPIFSWTWTIPVSHPPLPSSFQSLFLQGFSNKNTFFTMEALGVAIHLNAFYSVILMHGGWCWRRLLGFTVTLHITVKHHSGRKYLSDAYLEFQCASEVFHLSQHALLLKSHYFTTQLHL